MKNIKRFSFIIYMLSAFFFACNRGPAEISMNDAVKIKKRYSAEVFNYFYETVFFQDYVGKKETLFKWVDDIQIYMEGSPWKEDSTYLQKAIDEINKLELPVKISLVKHKTDANLVMYFGDLQYLEKKLHLKNYEPFRGIGVIRDSIDMSAVIGIANDAKSYKHLSQSDKITMRQSIILEELTQILGIPGDSWKYYESIFFEGKKKILTLSNIDKQVIKLLYEPAISRMFARKTFEKYFGDLLYFHNTPQKLNIYLTQQNIKKHYLLDLEKYSLLDGLVFKFPRNVFLRLKGDFDDEDLAFCKASINALNNVTKNLNLKLVEDDVWHALPSITIYYDGSFSSKTPKAERFIELGEMMYARRIKGEIKLSYSNSTVKKDELNTLLFQAIYKILGFDHVNEEVATIDSSQRPVLKVNYRDLFSLLYSDTFPDGFTQKGLQETIHMIN